MGDMDDYEKEALRALIEFNKQANLLITNFGKLKTKIYESTVSLEKTKVVQDGLTKRQRSGDRVKKEAIKLKLESLDITKKTLKVRIDELTARKDIAKILSQDRKDRIVDNRIRAKERVDLEKVRQEGVKRNILMRKSMMGTSQAFNFVTNSITKGRGILPTLGLLGKGAFESALAFKKKEEAEKAYNDAKSKGGVGKDVLEALKKTQLQTEKDFEDKTAGSKHLQGISKKLANAGTFFSKHAAGILIGAGAAGVLIGIIKKALDVSPMFQQMMKLMNFAVSMILRPIGDFFGFVLRPILIMLLRQFILPWFKYVYPAMRDIGTTVGEAVTDVLSGESTPVNLVRDIFGLKKDDYPFKPFLDGVANVTAGIVALAGAFYGFKLTMNLIGKSIKKILKLLGIEIPDDGNGKGNGNNTNKDKPTMHTDKPNSKPPNTETKTSKPNTNTNTNKPNTNRTVDIEGKVTETPKPKPKPRPAWINADGSYNPNWNKNPTTPSIWDKKPPEEKETKPKAGRKQFWENIQNKQKDIPKIKSSIKAQTSYGVSKFGNLARGFLRGVLSGEGLAFAFAPLLDEIPQMRELKEWMGDKMMEATGGEGIGAGSDEAFIRWRENFSKTISDITAADGGILNEPVVGFGQNTGRKYTMGERGREAVVPLNKTQGQGIGGGTTVNININNMSGDRQDVEKLRKTILEVLQQTSTNRVRA